jgi:threonine/homoserine/homoserine lactone efflux protein
VLKTLHWGGAAFLLWLAWKIATSGRVDGRPEGRPVGYLGAALFQWVNPKSWLVSAGGAGAFLSAEGGSPIAQAASLGGLFVLAALPSGLVWLTLGATVQRVLRGERQRRAFNAVMGVLLALSIALIVR